MHWAMPRARGGRALSPDVRPAQGLPLLPDQRVAQSGPFGKLASAFSAFLESGLEVLISPSFESLNDSIQKEAMQHTREDAAAPTKAWTSWAKDAFIGGASAAHKASKVQPTRTTLSSSWTWSRL